ncbi:nickel-responsive transcriptional regulator NikR, partial [Acidocella sp.]
MERITITIDDDLLASVDALVNAKGYTSRSEAIRDLLRAAARAEHVTDTDTPCVATLTYVYNHAQRDLPQRLADAQHDHHDLSVATTHVHFGHEDCLEVAILRGPAAAISAHANELTA